MSSTVTDGFSELYNFGDAKKKTDAATTFDDADLSPLPKAVRNRVFLNNLDSFRARHISSFLADQIQGALKAAGGAGEGGEEEEEEDEFKTPNFGAKYEIVGTLKEQFRAKTEDVLYTIKETDDNFMEEIRKCAFVVYDITEDESEISKALNTLNKIDEEIEQLKELGPKTFKNYENLRVFVLISTVMTWGLTKPIDPEEPDTPFNETDYRKRRPHPNYKEHIACEREVILKGKKNKDKLRTYVVCSGITYGEEEDELSFFFKMAWKNEEYLPVFLPGKNFIPLIHIRDFSRVIYSLLETTPKKPQYILAVEQTPCTLGQIVRGLCRALGRGKTKDVPKEEAFLYADMTQTVFERCTVNLNMEPGFIVDELELEWKSELNLAENIATIVAEFRKSRNLKPMRVIIHGPPAVGKTRLAEQLCEIYGAQHITVKTMIEDTIKDLRSRIDDEKAKLKAKEERQSREPEHEDEEAEEADDEEEEEEEVDIDEFEEQIRDIEGTMANAENGKLPDEYVNRLMKKYLSSNRCQNQGYILDGYPKTLQQVRELFGGASDEGEEEEEAEEEEEGGGGDARASKILPDHVITLQATDEFLCERLMVLPEKEIQGTHYSEEHMLRRLADFRSANTEDDTMLNFFDEIEIHPIVINAMAERYQDLEEVVKVAAEHLGPAMGLALTAEEEAEVFRCEEDLRKLKEEEERLENERTEQRVIEKYQNTMQEWFNALEKLQKEEEKLIVAESEPLRNYLMKFVFPTLTKGLLEVAKVKPYDPVDFLAEYLFKENPEGHMFDPSYTRLGELISNEQKLLEEIVSGKSGTDKATVQHTVMTVASVEHAAAESDLENLNNMVQ